MIKNAAQAIQAVLPILCIRQCTVQAVNIFFGKCLEIKISKTDAIIFSQWSQNICQYIRRNVLRFGYRHMRQRLQPL